MGKIAVTIAIDEAELKTLITEKVADKMADDLIQTYRRSGCTFKAEIKAACKKAVEEHLDSLMEGAKIYAADKIAKNCKSCPLVRKD